jgi:hypothetical protein
VLQRAWQQAIQRDLTRSAYVRAMFETGHDSANREVLMIGRMRRAAPVAAA